MVLTIKPRYLFENQVNNRHEHSRVLLELQTRLKKYPTPDSELSRFFGWVADFIHDLVPTCAFVLNIER